MMSEVHRYQVVTMLSAAGATIGYDPHGPDVVMAAEFDRVTAERDALQLRLNEADQRNDDHQVERQKLIAYGRNCGLDEAATLCNKMAWEAYYPPGTRFKLFTPKAETALGNLLIKAANAIASLPDGPYDRFKARHQKNAGASSAA